MEGGEGDITVPIPVFLIEHPKGRALFDTGLHHDCQHDPAGRPRRTPRWRPVRKPRSASRPGEEVSARLEGRSTAIPAQDRSFDHQLAFPFRPLLGGNALIPNATMLVQQREWDAGMDPDLARRSAAPTRVISTSATNCARLTASTTCSATGSVICLPTHGHTPGHQSLQRAPRQRRHRARRGRLLLLSDPSRAPPAALCLRQATRCSPRSTGLEALGKVPARGSSSATTPNSGAPMPQAPHAHGMKLP